MKKRDSKQRMAIHFFSEKIDFTLPKADRVATWLKEVATAESYRIATLNYIFCDDDYLLAINQEYLAHDTLTDVISFDFSDVANEVSGDIYISVPRVAENAPLFQVAFNHELGRVMVHGLLHLLGYDDTTPEKKQQMRTKEAEALLLPMIGPFLSEIRD